jgi:hypothetical protein
LLEQTLCGLGVSVVNFSSQESQKNQYFLDLIESLRRGRERDGENKQPRGVGAGGVV